MKKLDFTFDDGGRAVAGYKGNTGDCVTRAIAIALKLDYETVRQQLMAEKAALRAKSRVKPAKKYSSNSVFKGVSAKIYRPFLESKNWHRTNCQHIGHPSTIRMIPDHLPAGIVIVELRKHLVTVIDHVVHDTHQSHTRDEWIKMPNGAFHIDKSVQVPRTVYGYWTYSNATISANSEG